MKQIFFKIHNGVSLSRDEYAWACGFLATHTYDRASLILFDPTITNGYHHLLASEGLALIPPDSKEIVESEIIPIPPTRLSEDRLLELPFFSMPEYISRVIDIDDNILDLGCGTKAFSNQLALGKVTTVDTFNKFNPDILWDLNETPLPFEENSFNVVLLIDVVEHLYKDRGVELIQEAKRITSGKIFILTPTKWDDNSKETFNESSEYYKNTYNLHRSLWEEKDLFGFTRVYNKGIEDYYFGYWSKQ